MARRVNRAEIWLYEFKPPDKRRPVVVLSRPEVIPLLHTVMVAPITSAIRGAPSEVRVGADEGLKHESAVNLDHVQTVSKARLGGVITTLGATRMSAVRSALLFALGF